MNGMKRDFYHTCPYRRLADPMVYLPVVGVLSLVLACAVGGWVSKHKHAQEAAQKATAQTEPKQRQAGPGFPQWKKS